MNKGLLRAKAEYNAKEEVKSGQLPPHEYGIIVCGMRFFNGEFSEYYKDFCTLHRHEPPARLYGLVRWLGRNALAALLLSVSGSLSLLSAPRLKVFGAFPFAFLGSAPPCVDGARRRGHPSLRQASMALVTTSIAVKNKNSVPIVALDIAGPENGFPAEQHKDAYRYAHKHFLNKTVHAGEGFGPESIFQAVTDVSI